MLEILTWVAVVLAAIVLTEAIWVTVLCIKAHKRWEKVWKKKNKIRSVALLAVPAAFLPAMWVICGLLLVECGVLTYAILSFYLGGKTVKVAVPSTPKVKREKIERVVFNEPVQKETVAPTEEEIQELQALMRDSVSLDEATAALSDKLAARFVVLEKAENNTVENKCIVNIDTICETFGDGDQIDIEALKAKGLVKDNADYVKILGRGKVDKKLFVTANSFSNEAVKMILLTGGSVTKII